MERGGNSLDGLSLSSAFSNPGEDVFGKALEKIIENRNTSDQPNSTEGPANNGGSRSADGGTSPRGELANDRSHEFCRDFQRGHCPRGDGCWFQHVQRDDLPDIDLTGPGVTVFLGGRQICRDFLRGHCRRVINCPYFHIHGGERCRDFERLGDCKRGIMCPFIHVAVHYGQFQPRPVGRTGSSTGGPWERQGDSSGEGVVATAMNPVMAQSYAAPAMGNRAMPNGGPHYRHVGYKAERPVLHHEDQRRPGFVKTELCRDWSRFQGDCPRGSSCSYLHGHPGDPCRDFLRRGRCLRGSACPFSHATYPAGGPTGEVCMKFMRGECTRGFQCPYLHPTPTQGGPPGNPAAVPMASRKGGHLDGGAGKEGKDDWTRQVCRKFLRGDCTRGDTCAYVHAKPEAYNA